MDAEGGPVVDPTTNVIALNEAANRRQDDLREANSRRIDSELQCVKDVSNLHAAHARELVELRAEHAEKMAVAETSRLNAIRQVDAAFASATAEQSKVAVQTLATAAAVNADNLRGLVTSTAQTLAAQQVSTVAGITERLVALEKSSYEGKGKQSYSDPLMADLVAEMKSLRESRSIGTGKSAGIGLIWGGAVSLLGAFAAIAAALYAAFRQGG